ncbi:MAG: 4-hydroxybenzoate octaprenyltransferase [Pseudomonadota bacterium]|nr:4-hydroxybenzoate octaprenyltransferase [Pseudomonadota bacterium]
MNKISGFYRLARFDKPIGILLLLWPTMSALWLASNGFPDANILVAFIIGVVVMRSAGCVINDLADADIDKHVERTRKRPLATGELSTKEALVFLLFLLSIALCLAISLGLKVVVWSLGGLVLTIFYPFCKRFIKSPQVILGLTFSWSIPMAYVACGSEFNLSMFFLWVGVLIWIVVYDTFYALVDIDDDLKTGVFSTAILFGDKVSFVTSLSQITVLMAWAYLGIILEMSLLYFLMLIIVLLLFSRQQLLISDRQRKDCFKAFNESWYVGFFHFLGIFLSLS